MENYTTIDEAINLYGESVFGDETDICEVTESFPVKDRKTKSARRKKSYFKGKNRYKRVCQKGFTPYPNKESVIRGMMRKTNVIRVYCSSDNTRQKGFNHSIIRSLNSTYDKMRDYYEEAV